MTGSHPSVSVAIPAYNAAGTIRETLEHILAQTYHPLEIIVSDNHSTDDTAAIVRNEFSSRGVTLVTCPSVRPERASTLEVSMSVIDNFNTLIDRCQGTYVALYHADDLYDATIVQREVEFLEAHPEAVAVFTMGRTINAKGELLAISSTNVVAAGGHALFRLPELVNAVMLHGTFLMTPTFMVRRSALERAGKLRRTYEQAADYDWWFRLADVGAVGVIGDCLFSHRLGPQQDSRQGRTIYATRSIPIYGLLDDYLKLERVRVSITPQAYRANSTQRAVDDLRIARNLLLEKQSAEARKVLLRALRRLQPDGASRSTAKQVAVAAAALMLLVPSIFGLGREAGMLQEAILERRAQMKG